MPPAFPPEFRRRAVELFRERDKPVVQLASELGISESCLRRWAARDDVDTGRVDGVSSDERAELAAAPGQAPLGDGERDPAPGRGLLRPGERPPKMIYPVVRELAADGVPVATVCRVLQVSTSGYYAWRDRPASTRARSNLELVEVIRTIHADSGGTYGAPRVHAELHLGAPQLAVSRKRVDGIVGVHRRRRGSCTRRDPEATPSTDLVDRRFRAEGPDQLCCTDITQHRTSEGWLYCAVVVDVFSRRGGLVHRRPPAHRDRRRRPRHGLLATQTRSSGCR